MRYLRGTAVTAEAAEEAVARASFSAAVARFLARRKATSKPGVYFAIASGGRQAVSVDLHFLRYSSREKVGRGGGGRGLQDRAQKTTNRQDRARV